MIDFQPLLNPEAISNQKWREEQIALVYVQLLTYNHIDYIRDCIEGILMQKTTFPVKIVVFDDCSNDGTTEIIKTYSEQYPELFKLFIQPENTYKKSIRKKAVQEWYEYASSGKYIAKCEGDDYWTDPLKLQKQVSFLEANPDISLYCHNAVVKNHQTGVQSLFDGRAKKDKIFTTKDIIFRSWIAATASIVFRSGNYHNKSYSGPGDILIMFESSLRGNIYYDVTPMSVYNYQTIGSLSTELNSKVKYKRILTMYKSKFNFMNYVDKRTQYNFLFWTFLKRTRMVLGFIFQLIFR